jgi:hypothetical protein
LSSWFVLLSILFGLLDMTSALSLHWDLPSILNSSVGLFKKSILIFQIFYYKNAKNTELSPNDLLSPMRLPEL